MATRQWSLGNNNWVGDRKMTTGRATEKRRLEGDREMTGQQATRLVGQWRPGNDDWASNTTGHWTMTAGCSNSAMATMQRRMALQDVERR